MSSTRKGFAFLFSFLLVVALIPAFFAIPVETILFNPKTYQKALQDQKFYEQIPALVTQMLVRGDLARPQALLTLTINESNRTAIEKIIRLLFPSDWLEKQGDVILQGMSSYVNFKQENLVLEISLVDVKTRWQSANLEQSVLDSLPACTGGEIAEFSRAILSGGQAALPLCRPPAEVAAFVQPVIRRILLEAGRAIPEKFDLASMGLGVASFLKSERWQMIFNQYRLIRQLIRITPLAAAVWLVALILMTIRPPSQILKWIGGTLILAGAIGVLVSGLLWLLSGWVGENATELVQIYLRPGLVDLLVKAFAQVVSQFAMISSGIALLACLAGGIMRYIFSAIHKAG